MKKHKIWSQCSGVRNPAAYRKRADLETPESVDQDYNFITSIERGLQRADADVAERGVTLDGGDTKRLIRGQARLWKEIEDSGAIVMKAPAGLSRSKQNKTHWNNKEKCLAWTIEWVLPDGDRLYQNCLAKRTVQEAFTFCVGKKVLSIKRKPSEGIPPPKRRRGKPEVEDRTCLTQPHPEPALDEAPHQSRTEAENSRDRQEKDKTDQPGPPSMSDILSGLHFYLHRPNTLSNTTCVIPISLDFRIADIVKDHLLLEFPTILIRNEPPESLPNPFITEGDLEKAGEAQPVTSPVLLEAKEELNNSQEQSPSKIDERKILEVLQRDLKS